MSQSDYLEFGLSYEEAKNEVNALGNIGDIQIWALFTEDCDHTYAASIRSASVSVRELAAEYGGGGHACACGIKKIPPEKLPALIAALQNLANQA